MRRAILGACLAALLYPGMARSQDSDDPGAGPAVTEPEGSEVEFAPPTSSPTQGGVDQVAETYTVRPGDTLWDLSQRFLGNPWYWPKVWSYNPEIENPHWIYPGNVVRFYPAAEELPAQVAEGGDVPLEEPLEMPPQELADLSMGSLTAPDLMGQEEDLVAVAGPNKIGFIPPKTTVMRQDGFVTQRELEDAGVITRAFAEKDMLSTYDKVYVRFRNSSQVRVGEKYVIYRTVDEIQHPHTGEKFGYLTHVVGSLRVVSLDQHVATAIIDGTLDDIARGNFVGPWGSLEKQIISKPATRNISGVIISSLVPKLPYMGESHVVFLDKGKRDGVEEGNVFKVIRQGDPLSSNTDEAKRYPKEEVATIVVVDVTNEASAGLVLKAIRELEVGDRVETLPGGPAVSSIP